jgi:hypothetical protein
MTISLINADDRLYEIEFRKRSRRVGLADQNGNPLDRIYVGQSKNGVLWEDADPEQIKQASGGAQYGAGKTAFGETAN